MLNLKRMYIGVYEVYKGLYNFNKENTEYFDVGEAYDCTIGAVNKLLAGIYNCREDVIKKELEGKLDTYGYITLLLREEHQEGSLYELIWDRFMAKVEKREGDCSYINEEFKPVETNFLSFCEERRVGRTYYGYI